MSTYGFDLGRVHEQTDQFDSSHRREGAAGPLTISSRVKRGWVVFAWFQPKRFFARWSVGRSWRDLHRSA